MYQPPTEHDWEVMRASARKYRRLFEAQMARRARARAGGDLPWLLEQGRRRRAEQEQKAAAAAVVAALVALLLSTAPRRQPYDPFAIITDPFASWA